MPTKPADFRSDTITRPTPAMRAAMAAAAVGDDVFGDDPTVNELQQRLAEMLGKEAALFVPSGTMSNLIGVRLHCRPGDALICEAESHVFYYEQGGYAQINGTAVWPLPGKGGVLQIEQLETVPIREDPHSPRVKLLCLENTHNRGGGRIQPYENVESLCAGPIARPADAPGRRPALERGGRLGHSVGTMDKTLRHGQRLLQQGARAPVGSALVGPAELIREAVRHRKLVGGGMRQAGILAAAALYALDNHIERLADDHANARKLADGLRQISGVRVDAPDTNLVYFHLAPGPLKAAELNARLCARRSNACHRPLYAPRCDAHGCWLRGC